MGGVNITKEFITGLVSDAIHGTDMFITDIKVKRDNTIFVFLDGDTGVKVDACIKVSRHVEAQLDRDKCDFELNVSSFGIGRPLTLFRQFKNAEGKSLSIKMLDGKQIKGILLEATPEVLRMEVQTAKKKTSEQQDIIMKEIAEAKIEVVFR